MIEVETPSFINNAILSFEVLHFFVVQVLYNYNPIVPTSQLENSYWLVNMKFNIK